MNTNNDKSISNDKSCAYCEASIGRNEFKKYRLKIGTSDVTCSTCQNVNHLVPSKDKVSLAIRLVLSWGIFGILAVPAIAPFFEITYFKQMGLTIPGIPPALLIFGGLVFGRILYHLMLWRDASLIKHEDSPLSRFISNNTQSKTDKS